FSIIPQAGRIVCCPANKIGDISPFLSALELVDVDAGAELRLQRLELSEDLCLAVGLLELRRGPALHQQQVVRGLRREEVVVLQVALLLQGVGPNAQVTQSLIKGLPLAGLALISDIPS